MMRVKRIIISVVCVAIILVTCLSATASTFSRPYNGLNRMTVYDSNVCTFVTYSDSCILSSSKSGYIDNCKYVSCSSYRYIIPTGKSTGSFVKADSSNSGYVKGTASSLADHCLDLSTAANIDKTIFYGEIYSGGSNQTGREERIWITKYRNPSIAKYDGLEKSKLY